MLILFGTIIWKRSATDLFFSLESRNKIVELRPAGKIASGITEIPFSMHIRQPKEDNLEKFYETFHGGNINIQYLVTVDISRGYLYKSLSTTMEFIVESDKGGFRIIGKMATQCSLSDPVSGELTVEASAVPISSIDIHLLRVESILLGEKIVTEKSVVQTTQVCTLSYLLNIYNSIYLS
ncbi:uncharacterized protein LOC133730714 [Rosa rugosa]|uniref:uncharacterized protein LOC133730714 n=1 Tax=Rosa rugosa TaxID=74645 RepID=UPI002B411E70|nr:uncharacterized protein LOC133730714 [Rosa rugosa]